MISGLSAIFPCDNIEKTCNYNVTDYDNKEFVIEDCDGRYIAFGCK